MSINKHNGMMGKERKDAGVAIVTNGNSEAVKFKWDRRAVLQLVQTLIDKIVKVMVVQHFVTTYSITREDADYNSVCDFVSW